MTVFWGQATDMIAAQLSARCSGLINLPQGWDRKGDVFARLAVYDERAEILEPAKDGRLPRRQAHYVTLQFEGGKTGDGVPVSVTDKDRVRVSGYLRDSAYSESLREFLRKAQKIDRIADGDDDVRVGRVPTYVVVRSLVRFTPR